ncbi:ribonuclease R [Micractinium conductrix]|uniref:Ribonuclease R n=1 Tax=Micractinium conductrix TaxID=554055 RepID=A0A2P6V6Y5_9CHLO|nr:ribonuclease R [Micractinium conductrix]|eukprot:PSC69854.1 ribonuclease R [Micractinium conductrix]
MWFGKDSSKREQPVATTSTGDKSCCSDKKEEQQQPAAAAAAAASTSKEEAALSSFFFGGAAADGDTPLVGYCRGSDSAIQACVWTPGPPKNSGSSGKKDKGKAKGSERFTIIF